MSVSTMFTSPTFVQDVSLSQSFSVSTPKGRHHLVPSIMVHDTSQDSPLHTSTPGSMYPSKSQATTRSISSAAFRTPVKGSLRKRSSPIISWEDKTLIDTTPPVSKRSDAMKDSYKHYTPSKKKQEPPSPSQTLFCSSYSTKQEAHFGFDDRSFEVTRCSAKEQFAISTTSTSSNKSKSHKILSEYSAYPKVPGTKHERHGPRRTSPNHLPPLHTQDHAKYLRRARDSHFVGKTYNNVHHELDTTSQLEPTSPFVKFNRLLEDKDFSSTQDPSQTTNNYTAVLSNKPTMRRFPSKQDLSHTCCVLPTRLTGNRHNFNHKPEPYHLDAVTFEDQITIALLAEMERRCTSTAFPKQGLTQVNQAVGQSRRSGIVLKTLVGRLRRLLRIQAVVI